LPSTKPATAYSSSPGDGAYIGQLWPSIYVERAFRFGGAASWIRNLMRPYGSTVQAGPASSWRNGMTVTMKAYGKL
jgi:hypothetical protein